MGIDVLAVMETAMGKIDQTHWCCDRKTLDPAADLREARAAVAELIAKVHDVGLLYEAGCDMDAAIAELEELASRCGGAK